MKKGFTLIELLVVIGIISILSSIAMVNINSARDKARIARGLDFEQQVDRALRLDIKGEWKFDNSDFGDTSGYGRAGTTAIPPTISSDGCLLENCLHYSGGSNYLDVLGFTPNDFTSGKFTISAWLHPISPSLRNTWFMIRTPSQPGLLWFEYYGGQMRSNVMNGQARGGSLRDGRWQHFAVIYDGSNIYHFLDGTLVELESETPAGGSFQMPENAEFVRIGKSLSGSVWPGMIDRVRIYDSAPDF